MSMLSMPRGVRETRVVTRDGDIVTWIGSGLLVVAGVTAVASLSHQFIYGQGHQDRPIIAVLCGLAVSFLGYVWALWGCRRLTGGTRGWRVAWVCIVAALARFVLWQAEPIQEVDVYRYLWDGNAVIHGTNPYRLSPTMARARPEQAGGGAAFVDSVKSPAARAWARRINYPSVPTVYGPLAQWSFALGQRLTPWRLTGWRVVVCLTELLIMFVLWRVLLCLGKPLEWLVLYAWSPLVLKELTNSLHVDVLVVAALAVCVWGAVRGRWVIGSVALAAAALVKLPLLILVPVWCAWLARRPRRVWWGLLIVVGACLAGYAPFASAGVSLIRGLAAFAGRWRVNDSLFGAYVLIVGWWPGVVSQHQHLIARVMAAGTVVMMTVGLACWQRRQSEHVHIEALAGSSALTITCLLLLAPTGNPWYATWLLPWLMIVPFRSVVWLTGCMLLYYMDFFWLYHGAPEQFAAIRWVEYGLVIPWIAWESYQWLRRSPLSSAV